MNTDISENEKTGYDYRFRRYTLILQLGFVALSGLVAAILIQGIQVDLNDPFKTPILGYVGFIVIILLGFVIFLNGLMAKVENKFLGIENYKPDSRIERRVEELFDRGETKEEYEWYLFSKSLDPIIVSIIKKYDKTFFVIGILWFLVIYLTQLNLVIILLFGFYASFFMVSIMSLTGSIKTKK